MFGEPHDIPHEFPEYSEVIEALQESNSLFKDIYQEYHDLDREIHDIEQNVEAVSDFYAEDLKKKRVLLKDKIYTMLRSHDATVAA